MADWRVSLSDSDGEDRAEDETKKNKIGAKQRCEGLCFAMLYQCSTDKFEENDKHKIEKAAEEILDWVNKNPLAEKDEYEAKRKGLADVVNPIITKADETAVAARKEARKAFENYCNRMRNTTRREKLSGPSFTEDDKAQIEKAVQATSDWLVQNPWASKDEFEAKRLELQDVVNSIRRPPVVFEAALPKVDEAKKSLERYCRMMHTKVREGSLQDKLEADDKNKIGAAVLDTLAWLHKNQLAMPDEFKKKQKDLEGVIHAITDPAVLKSAALELTFSARPLRTPERAP